MSGMDIGIGRLLGVAVVTMTGAVSAHHSFAGEFDVSRAVHLQGVVTNVELANPHSYVYLDVRTGTGRVERWALEGPSVANIRRSDWNKQPVKVGDRLAVCGYPGIKKPAAGAARKLSAAVLTTADGEQRLWENYRVGKCDLDR